MVTNVEEKVVEKKVKEEKSSKTWSFYVCCFFIYLVQPILDKLFGKASNKAIKISSIMIILVVSIDFVVTILGYIIK